MSATKFNDSVLETIPTYITSAKGLGSEKRLLIFSTIHADVGWVDGSKKVKSVLT